MRHSYNKLGPFGDSTPRNWFKLDFKLKWLVLRIVWSLPLDAFSKRQSKLQYLIGGILGLGAQTLLECFLVRFWDKDVIHQTFTLCVKITLCVQPFRRNPKLFQACCISLFSRIECKPIQCSVSFNDENFPTFVQKFSKGNCRKLNCPKLLLQFLSSSLSYWEY